jgi:dihydroorotase
MEEDRDEPPTSWDRRRLLLALGLGAVNVAVLYRIEVPRSPSGQGSGSAVRGAEAVAGPVRRGSIGPAPDGPTAGDGTAGVALPPVPTGEPPALPGADPAPGVDHVFDLVIAGGRVMDPASGFDGLANVGIDGDRITALSAEPLRGLDTIDASGRVVAPGFVDLLSAEPNSFGVWLKLADGVTTNLAMHGVNNFADPFFRRYRDRTPIHFGGAFHHHFMRGIMVGAAIDRPLTAAQLDRLVGLAEDGLDQGFAGVSLSPEYSPGTTTEEMERLARVAADRGHVCFVHVRHSDPDPPGTGIEAIDEMLGVAQSTGVALHIEHLTSTGGTHAMDQAIARIDQARRRGLDVTACLYPYDFWGTFLASARFSPGWRERYRLTEADLQVAGTPTRLTPETLAEAVGENQLVAALDSIPESAIRAALVRPWTMVASDAIPTIGLNNHPRGAGTFARTIARYVRELGVLDLMTGLAKLTILPARRVEAMIPAMATKGRLQRGADADIVVFDPETIADRATVAEPANPSVGIDQVVVAGRRALRDGQVDRTVLAGRPLPSSI